MDLFDAILNTGTRMSDYNLTSIRGCRRKCIHMSNIPMLIYDVIDADMEFCFSHQLG